MGFCFLNNAAIAAQYALDDLGAERVAIFDWDVHHGNGTQDIFYDSGDVFTRPFTRRASTRGRATPTRGGEGEGAGTTLNVPFPRGFGDAEYCAAVEELLAPALAEFDPRPVRRERGLRRPPPRPHLPDARLRRGVRAAH